VSAYLETSRVASYRSVIEVLSLVFTCLHTEMRSWQTTVNQQHSDEGRLICYLSGLIKIHLIGNQFCFSLDRNQTIVMYESL